MVEDLGCYDPRVSPIIRFEREPYSIDMNFSQVLGPVREKTRKQNERNDHFRQRRRYTVAIVRIIGVDNEIVVSRPAAFC